MELILKIVMGFVAVQRLAELILAQKNQNQLVRRGAIVVKETNYFFMVLLHTILIFYLLYFTFFQMPALDTLYFVVGLSLVVLGQIFRVSTILTLKERWTTRIVVLPQSKLVESGLFKYISHPNYVGVFLEVLGLPLMLGHLKAAMGFALVNSIILILRILKENQSLNEYSPT